MAKKDYYESLGISKSASKDEIKKAYRKLAKEFHPDKNKSAEAEQRFKEIQEAYDILSDEQKRSAYDQYGFAGTQSYNSNNFGGFSQGGFSGDFGDLGDIFGNLFGGSFSGFGGSSNRRSEMQGRDLEYTLKIEFLESVFGIEKEIEYSREIRCTKCSGSGAKDGKTKTCPKCSGSGRVRRVQNTFFGSMQVESECPECRGLGKIISEKCTQCKGAGVTNLKEKFKVKIPQGIPDGVTLRFSGRGDAGRNGGGFGDLYLTVEVKPHKRLEKKGDDIYFDLEVDVVTAVLGGEVQIPTVHGDVWLKIPQGTQQGKVLRLKEKGSPRFRGGGNGDQYIKIILKVPTNLSGEERKKWENLKK